MVTLGMGRSTPWTGSQPLALKVFADDSSPMVFTPDSLYPIMGYTFKRLGNAVLSDGVTAAEVVFSHPNGEPVHFVFKEGESLGRPDPGVHVPMDERLQMVDAQGWACTGNPVYYDLYETDGRIRRFRAAMGSAGLGAFVSETDSRGLVTTPADMGVDLVYGPDGVRQFLTPSRLADIRVVKDGYDVAIYPLQSVPAKDPATGLYPVPAVPTHRFLSVRSANGGKRAVVTLKTGDSDPRRYIFDYVSGDWSLTHPDGVQEIKTRVADDSTRARLSKEIRSPDNALLSKSVMNYKWESWGYAMTNKVEGTGDATRTTSWTYYTSGNGIGKVKTSLSPTGLLTEYTYDSKGRKQSIRRSGPDMMTEVTTYSYASVDPSDAVPPVDTRPRTVVKTLNGIECERTYYVYSPLTNIVERVGSQGVPYGAPNVLRTVTAFYPVVANDWRSGKVQSVRHEDGRLDLYDYALADDLWTETVTHLHVQSPAPVSGKTTRDITITNRRGETIERKTEAFIDGSWYAIARDRMTYNTTGKRIRTENLAGQATVFDWDCCHKVSETQPDGSTVTWDYNDDGRVIASSRLIPLDRTNVTWVTTCYAYDNLGRQTATWTTNFAACLGTPATATTYDALGRIVSHSVPGYGTSQTSFSPSGLIVTNTDPNGATMITRRNADGDTLSNTGTGITPEFFSRGVLADGTRWTKTVQGESAASPRFTTRYENLLGQVVREERSGFQGAVIATVHTYDSLGHLIRTDPVGEPTTEFAYDNQGTRVATTTSAQGGGECRKTESLSNFALIDSNVWFVQTNITSCSDTAIAPLVTSRGGQLTGLTPSNPSRTLATDIRGNVTESWTEFGSGMTTAKRRVPEATNIASIHSKYGVQIETVSHSAVTNTACYDGLGRQIASIDGRGNTTRTEYDALGRRIASIDADGNRTAYAYDRFGNLASVTDPLGDAIVYEYDLRGRKIYEGGATYPVRYEYDVFGNKVSMTTYRNKGALQGDTTRWFYDEASNCMTNKVYADGKGPTYEYDAYGRLVKRTWARGIETMYSYDGWGNLTNTVYSDDTPSILLQYDALGRQTQAIDAAGTTTFAYDVFGSLTNETVVGIAGTNTIERFYDAFGRDAGYALNGVRQSTIGYDSATGRLSSMMAAGSETPFTWHYLDGSDLKSSLTYPNGLTASCIYGNRNELLQVRNAFPINVISQYDYTYDAAGRRVQITRSGSAMSETRADDYGYNARSELIYSRRGAETAEEYAYRYDDIGNRLSSLDLGTNRTYMANALNQYTQISNLCDSASLREEFLPQFDADGNQTFVRTTTGTWSVTYNGENRPIRWDNGDMVITMSFDRMGRRVTKNDKRFVYDGYLQIADNAGNAYVWDPTEPIATRPLAWQRSALDTQHSVLFFTHDGNKNVSEVISADGSLSAHYEYAPFGAVTAQSGALASVNPFRFSSEYAEDDLSLVYYNYRHYEPLTGLWLSRDPVDEDNDELFYAFCVNSPISGVDVLGQAWFVPPETSSVGSKSVPFSVSYETCYKKPSPSQLELDRDELMSKLVAWCPMNDTPIKTKWGTQCCKDSCQKQARLLAEKIYSLISSKSEGLWSGGWFGNLLSYVGKGRGCVEWQNIVYSAYEEYASETVSGEQCFRATRKTQFYMLWGFVQHNWVGIELPGTPHTIDVDPWGSGGSRMFSK